MNEQQGSTFIPVSGGLIVFLFFGTAVFLAIEFLFQTSDPTMITLYPFQSERPVVEIFFIVGMFTALTIGVIAFLLLRSRFALASLVDKKTEDLIKSRDFFLRLFDESPVPYLMVERNGTILLPNKAAQRLFGRTADELRQYKFFHFNDEAYISESRLIADKFDRGVAVSDEELEVVRKDGSKRWVRMSALPFREYGNKSNGGVVSMLDITEQKAIDRVKTEFVSLASHQLRTPLSAMKWYGEMVLSGNDGELTEKQRKHIEKIYKGNERMIDLVNLLLSASRLELGSLTIDITKIDPTDIVKQILEELSVTIQQKDLHIVENYSGDSSNFFTDSKLVTMIIQNLLSNAVKYSTDGGEVLVSLDFTNENLKMEIADTGLGIPEAQQDKIFTKMFRADNARQQVTDGTGLGLYIVKQATEALGGEISFTSKQNEGTIFKVVLPNGTHGSITT